MMYRLIAVALCVGAFAPACGDDSDPSPGDVPDASPSGDTLETSGSSPSSESEPRATSGTESARSDTSASSDAMSTSGGNLNVDADAGAFTISSPNFANGDLLPDEYTCEGKPFGGGHSPELNWSGAPEGTKSYALVFKDLTLLEQPRFAYHWAAWNIPFSVSGIPEQLSVGQFPLELEGGEQFRAGPPHAIEFFGPCPSWRNHCFGEPRANDSYAFTLYAFDVEELTPPAPVDDPEVNYVSLLSAYFDEVAVAVTELNAASNASPSSAPMCPADGGTHDGGLDGGSDGDSDGGDSDGGETIVVPMDAATPAADASLDAG